MVDPHDQEPQSVDLLIKKGESLIPIDSTKVWEYIIGLMREEMGNKYTIMGPDELLGVQEYNVELLYDCTILGTQLEDFAAMTDPENVLAEPTFAFTGECRVLNIKNYGYKGGLKKDFTAKIYEDIQYIEDNKDILERVGSLFPVIGLGKDYFSEFMRIMFYRVPMVDDKFCSYIVEDTLKTATELFIQNIMYAAEVKFKTSDLLLYIPDIFMNITWSEVLKKKIFTTGGIAKVIYRAKA